MCVNKIYEKNFTKCLEMKNKIFIFATVNLNEERDFTNKQ